MVRAISGGNTFRRHLLFVVAVLSFIGVMRPIATQAQTCGTDCAVKEGEMLAQIASRVYGNPAQWTTIFYANQDRLGTIRSLLIPGFTLRINCFRCGHLLQ